VNMEAAKTYQEVQKLFDGMTVPCTNRTFYLTKAQYLALGGTEEGWDALPYGGYGMKMLVGPEVDDAV